MPYYKFKITTFTTFEGSIWAEDKEEANDKLNDYESNLEDINTDDYYVDETVEVKELYKEEE